MRRPSEEKIDTILGLIRGGADIQSAIRHQGVDPGEFLEWMRKPSNKDVRDKLGRAVAQADLNDISVIQSASNTRAEAASGTWQAAKARLEMRRAERAEMELAEINALCGC